MAFRMVNNFLMHAVIATFGGLPAARKRTYSALIGALHRIALTAAMYKAGRTWARPAAIWR